MADNIGKIGLDPGIASSLTVYLYNRNCISEAQLKQEAQLMLRNPRDRMFYVNRVSAYLVPFSR